MVCALFLERNQLILSKNTGDENGPLTPWESLVTTWIDPFDSFLDAEGLPVRNYDYRAHLESLFSVAPDSNSDTESVGENGVSTT